jgi:hypothetical protein
MQLRNGGGIAPLFLTTAPDRVVSLTSRPLYPRVFGNHWIGGWVGPRAGLGAVEKRKIFFPAGNRAPAVQPPKSATVDISV